MGARESYSVNRETAKIRQKVAEKALVIDADSMFDIKLADRKKSVDEVVEEIEAWCDGMRQFVEKVRDQPVQMLKVLTPKRTFRNELTSTYKAKRKKRSDRKSEALEKAHLWFPDTTTIVTGVEADDIVVYASMHDCWIAAIDKDVKGVTRSPGIDYKKRKMFAAVSNDRAKRTMLQQALQGDGVDGIKGAKGIGVMKSKKIMSKKIPSWYEFVAFFESEADAILSIRLVNMEQFNGTEIVLWDKHLY